jgi:hypothetical protein
VKRKSLTISKEHWLLTEIKFASICALGYLMEERGGEPDLEEVDGEAPGSEEPRRTRDTSYPRGGATEVAPA